MDPRVVQTTVPAPMPNASTGSGQMKNRFNLNHNFILVPAGGANILGNNGQMSNLIATNHNSIVNKGKIMILTTTTTPITSTGAIAGTNIVPNTGAVGPAQLATLAPNQCVQVRPNTILPSNCSAAPVAGTTLATSFITNIKMNPGTSGGASSAALIQDITAPISSKAPQTFQMFTPIVPTIQTPQTGQKQKRNVSAKSVAAKSFATKSKATEPTNVPINSTTTPIVLNGGSLIINDRPNTKFMKNAIGKRAMSEDVSQIDKVDGAFSDSQKNEDEKKILSDETLDRSSPELWPEPVPGAFKVLTNASAPYDVDGDVQGMKTNSEEDHTVPLSENHSDSKPGSNNSEQSSQKLVKSFTMTPYGLESMAESEEEQDDDDSDDESSCDSDEPATEKSQKIKNENANEPKIQYANEPRWHKDFDEEEISMLYGFGSLTANGLLEKIKEIQNVTYQLNLEEEKEMARARYLDILVGSDSRDDDEPPNLLLDQEIDEIFYGTGQSTPASLSVDGAQSSVNSAA